MESDVRYGSWLTQVDRRGSSRRQLHARSSEIVQPGQLWQTRLLVPLYLLLSLYSFRPLHLKFRSNCNRSQLSLAKIQATKKPAIDDCGLEFAASAELHIYLSDSVAHVCLNVSKVLREPNFWVFAMRLSIELALRV